MYYCDINFSVNYTTVQKTDKEIINPKTQNLRRYELNKSAIRHMVQNPEDIETYDTKVRAIVDKENIIEDSKRQLSTTSAFNTQIPDYIIITNEQLRPAFETLANWKIKKGLFTIIQTVEEIESNYHGSDLPEIKSTAVRSIEMLSADS